MERKISASISAIVVFISFIMPISGIAQTASSKEDAASAQTVGQSSASISYADYIMPYENEEDASGVLLLGEEAETADGAYIKGNYLQDGNTAVVVTDDGSATWNFEVEQPGVCEIAISYTAAASAGGDLEIGLLLDGKVPFEELSAVSLKRLYKQDNEFQQNVSGDDVIPTAEEIFEWKTRRLGNVRGGDEGSYRLYLSEGTHQLTVQGARGEIAIRDITLDMAEPIPDYATYAAKNSGQAAAEPIVLEGEHFTYKNDTTVLPEVDTSSPLTSPLAYPSRKLNTVGGDGWKQPGSAVTWTFDVQQDGVYVLDIRFRQNILDGIYTSRRLLIDDEVPFQEAEAIRFMSGDGWQVQRLGNEDGAYQFYLEKGEHTLTLEAVMGDAAGLVSSVEDALTTLNAVYRRIVMITGVSPDAYRDYNFENLIPEEIDEMKRVYSQLQTTVDEISLQAGVKGSYTSTIQKLLFQLEKMTEDPETIAKYLVQFKTNLGALGTWLLTALEQPLEIDVIYLARPNDDLPKAGAGFFQNMWHQVKVFTASFFSDYSSVSSADGAEYENSLTVWMQTGRDQAEVLRRLIDTGFSPENRTSVKLEVVVADTILKSVLAGRGPDVVLNCPSTEPINYAIRNAAVDLAQLPGYEETASVFFEAALEPYCFDGSVYALPETFTFPMFFYRTDIFAELGFEVPETWEDMLLLIPELQGKGLSMAFPAGSTLTGYATVLYQNGGDLYRDDGARTNLDSQVALQSFKEYSELFTLHDLPVQYDFANRFRTGEMPCGIADYSLYNTLSVFAPEIQGQWEMVPIPGKAQEDGSLSRATAGTGIGSMILATSENVETGWEFLQWWLSAPVQSEFGRGLESVLGSAAKYATANREALTQMSWTRQEYTNLLEQAQSVRAIPEVPGGYYLQRVVSFAFNRTYNQSSTQRMAEEPTEVLRGYIVEFNDELTRKRSEFGLD